MIKTTDVKKIDRVELKSGEIVVYIFLNDGRKFCLAVPSWHVEIDGLISYPAIGGHYDAWLRNCGYSTPCENYSQELSQKLKKILLDNESGIMDNLGSEDANPDFWARLWK